VTNDKVIPQIFYPTEWLARDLYYVQGNHKYTRKVSEQQISNTW